MANKGNQKRVSFEVELTDEAFYSYASLASDRLFEHVTHDLELLRDNPELEHAYDPVYAAQTPPFECRVLYCEHLGIYYRLDETLGQVIIFAIIDQRKDSGESFA